MRQADVSVGMIVKYDGVRGEIISLFHDKKDMVKVCTFPQDVQYCEDRHYERWPISEMAVVGA